MAQDQVTTTINRPVEDVFGTLTKIENQPLWSSATLEAAQTSPGPVGVGSTARFVAKFLGRRIETQLRITEFEPNRRLSGESTGGPFPLRSTFALDAGDGGTRVTCIFEIQPGGFFKLAEPLVVTMVKRQLQGDLNNLKDLMEAGAL
jgi:uncharacterized membrane protein